MINLKIVTDENVGAIPNQLQKIRSEINGLETMPITKSEED